jgi:hypothetical protein
MKWWILSTQEAEEWNSALGNFWQTDVFFLPEYHRIYEENGDGKACAFLAKHDDQVLLYPFLVRPIKKARPKSIQTPWYDIETVYGYSGPLCTTTNTSFLAKAWSAFADWCQESHIIAEFIRFNPLVGNHRYVTDTCNVILDRETVVLNLDCSTRDLWDSYPSVQRNMVRKAIKRGLCSEEMSTTEALGAFQELYAKTMDRAKARDYYYFSDIYFHNLHSLLHEKLKLFVVQDQGHVVAGALFLCHDDKIHYHLSGSDPAYRKVAPTNYLLHTVARWGQEHGFRYLHLGGGRTNSSHDSLLRFKTSISRSRLMFHIGTRVHNQQVYDSLCTEWMHKHKTTKRPSYFLLYRLEEQT